MPSPAARRSVEHVGVGVDHLVASGRPRALPLPAAAEWRLGPVLGVRDARYPSDAVVLAGDDGDRLEGAGPSARPLRPVRGDHFVRKRPPLDAAVLDELLGGRPGGRVGERPFRRPVASDGTHELSAALDATASAALHVPAAAGRTARAHVAFHTGYEYLCCGDCVRRQFSVQELAHSAASASESASGLLSRGRNAPNGAKRYPIGSARAATAPCDAAAGEPVGRARVGHCSRRGGAPESRHGPHLQPPHPRPAPEDARTRAHYDRRSRRQTRAPFIGLERRHFERLATAYDI